MNTHSITLFTSLLLTGAISAQGYDFFYTVSQPERTLTGSGGTVLQYLYPNDIVGLQVNPCPSRAEKWAPREAFEVMAGDENGDDAYQRINLFGAIDALLARPGSAAGGSFRSLYFSVAAPMGTAVSGSPFRPGDIARIVRLPSNGTVEYFIRAEQIQIAIGLPATPVVIDVDAACFGYNQGLFLSLDTDIACAPCGGPTVLRDGDVFCIPPWAYTLTASGTIGGVAPGSAVRVYTETQMNTMTATAQVRDRFGACVSSIGDVEALDIDWLTPSTYTVPGCGGVVSVPTLLFTGETLTGGAVLTTALGGSIHTTTCSPLGKSCGGISPTLGDQIGLLPPSALLGVGSYVNALAGHQRIFEFAAEAATPVIPAFSPATIDFVTPGTPFVWVFMTFAPGGPGAVTPSLPFTWGWMGFPEYYPTPNFMAMVPGGTGYATYTSPAIPWPVDLVFQGATLTSATIEVSTPTTVEVF